MNRLNNNDIMDYLDGTLDARRRGAIEEHLKTHAEDAQMVAEMKIAMQVLHDLEEVEPVRVAEDFWPKLRDKLPEKPGRGWLGRSFGQFGAWFAPSPMTSPLRLSLSAGIVTVLIIMATFMFAPQKATHESVAQNLTAEEKTFIQQGLDRHAAYEASQPLSGSMPLALGDARNSDHGDDEDEGHERMP